MKENKQIKISLKMAIILIIIVLLIIGIVTTILINLTKNNTNEIPKQGYISQTSPDSNEDFSIKFLQMENNNSNMIYSPLSIKYALNMLNEGANGNTKTQIENIIGNLSLTKYDNIKNILSLANSIYIRDDYEKYVKKEYIKQLTQKYNSEVKYDSFNNAYNINKWIENKTLGIIKNMLKDETVQNPDNKMMLVNALAIDMEWLDSFDAEYTHGKDFNLANGNKMTATTMHKETSKDTVSYYKDQDVTSLTMDLKQYNDTQLEFIAVMPNNNLSDYINEFKIDDLNNIIEKSTPASETKNGVDISIPRFSFDYDLKLKDDLINLGITDAFNQNSADFSNMTNSPNGLYVGDALHKADIDFTEKGIKAAAVTVILMTENAAIVDENKPIELKFDKPFLFAIRDKNTGEIWFVGTVYEPNHWENDKLDYQYR